MTEKTDENVRQNEAEEKPKWSKTVEERIADGEIDPAYFFEGGKK